MKKIISILHNIKTKKEKDKEFKSKYNIKLNRRAF